mgnify:CR=1 FL=1|tara:strand:+ start:474 stop:722 length:249 start_codon:yes stop_codon:yes gene_type:complete
MSKNNKISKPSLSKSSLSAKPKINLEENQVSRNIKVEKKNTAINTEKLNIKFDTYHFLNFPSNYIFVIAIIYLGYYIGILFF